VYQADARPGDQPTILRAPGGGIELTDRNSSPPILMFWNGERFLVREGPWCGSVTTNQNLVSNRAPRFVASKYTRRPTALMCPRTTCRMHLIEARRSTQVHPRSLGGRIGSPRDTGHCGRMQEQALQPQDIGGPVKRRCWNRAKWN